MDASNTRIITIEIPGSDGPIEASISRDDASIIEALLGGRTRTSVRASIPDSDTAGHGADASVIEFDVEGHAITLRLPQTVDLELLRGRLAKAVTITVVATAVAIGTVGLSHDPGTFTQVPAARGESAPHADPPTMRREILLRINTAPDGDLVVPLAGDELQAPPPPRPGEGAKAF
ncbi:MAG: hypothetical protein ABIZ34_03735 [Candidatus Limnocylindrales bacterium]